MKWWLVLAVSLSVSAAGAEDKTCQVSIVLRDSKSGKAMAGVVRVGRDGEFLELGSLQDRCVGLPLGSRQLGWHVLMGECKIELPAIDGLKVEAFSGIETDLGERTLALAGKAEESVEISLKRIFSAAESGWVAGNTHVHLRDLTREQSDRYLREVPVGDGLSVVFVSHLERALVDRTYITNSYSRQDLVNGLSTKSLKFGYGEEHRHNFGGGGEGFGHVMLLDLQELVRPVSIGPGISQSGSDSPPLRRGIDAARAQDATVIWCHNGLGLEDLPNWIAGRVDAQNIFDGGNRGSYEDTFYRYLNVGMKVPFSTGTDWFIYDFSRAYVPMAQNEDLSAARWLDGIRAGKGFITNGPWLEFSVAGEKPGAELEAGKKTVVGGAVGRHDFGSLQVIHNGTVVAEASAQNGERGFEARIEIGLAITEPGWLALRIQAKDGIINELGEPLFAHTSPVYLTVDGRRRFDAQVAREMIEEMKAGLAAIEEQGAFAADSERAVVGAIYAEGTEILEERLKAYEK